MIPDDPLHVVSGVAIREHRILMGKRKLTGLRPGLWELPGGKVEWNESPREALIREWGEELGLPPQAQALGPHITVATLRLECILTISLYHVQILPGFAPVAKDHAELCWTLPAAAMQHLPCSPGFYLHYADLMTWMRDHPEHCK